ncbi:Lsr2 family protein [Streptomyces sp. NPDC088775]|uniref:histone-like nucleoid-structuring protein Lsr2 n=1 Tax=Streptomyces sp. NPDC088775 TaxID=3365896 RepID=UPI0037F7D985
MARIEKVILTDDLEAESGNKDVEAHEQLRFALDGHMYDIDLTAENAAQLRSSLKPYVDAGREAGHVPGRTDILKRSARRPMTTGMDNSTTEARAWAVEHGLIPAGQRGRLAAKYIEAHRAFKDGNRDPLSKLLAIPHQSEEGDADWNPSGNEPVKQLDHAAAESAAARALAKMDSEPSEPAGDDPAEAAAHEHYKPITRSARVADQKKWDRRTGYGCDRTAKIGDWTLTERIDALSAQNLRILGMLAGEIGLAKGGKVSHLTTSDVRLENLEVIEEDLTSPHGWAITDFGRYAYKVRTSNG